METENEDMKLELSANINHADKEQIKRELRKWFQNNNCGITNFKIKFKELN